MIYAKTGMKGFHVQQWQKLLNTIGKSAGLPVLSTDGVFGSQTLSATIKIQKIIGVTADGVVGQGTVDAFDKHYPWLRAKASMTSQPSVYALPTQNTIYDKVSFRSPEKVPQSESIPVSKPIFKPNPPMPEVARKAIQAEQPLPTKKASMLLPVLLIGGSLFAFLRSRFK